MRFLFILVFGCTAFAQNTPDTGIFLFNINTENNNFQVENGRSISHPNGYNNQPSFYDNEHLIYAAIREGETDIAQYNLQNSETSWISNTEIGSEFSPQRFSKNTEIAAVRLDTTGLQRLYSYDYKSGQSKVLIPEAKIGYFSFFNSDEVLTAVLSESGLDLVMYHLKNKSSEKIISNAGRSIHKVPGNNTMSYTLPNEEGNYDVYLLDPTSNKSFFVCELPNGTQDFTWVDEYRILTGVGSNLYIFDTFGGEAWVKVADLSKEGITNISRLAVNADEKKLALVGTAFKKPK